MRHPETLILSAVRGPDNGTDAIKGLTTAVVRWYLGWAHGTRRTIKSALLLMGKVGRGYLRGEVKRALPHYMAHVGEALQVICPEYYQVLYLFLDWIRETRLPSEEAFACYSKATQAAFGWVLCRRVLHHADEDYRDWEHLQPYFPPKLPARQYRVSLEEEVER